ncbi:IS3 family transposase [Ferdinandcohnia sp. SAFN-114]|uniref:IS3 family transposase n=1 Tax=Ferdinandcohnia sp. SAFN-114 TaxID=3387275 RepID=UPI003F7E813D
MKFVYPRVLTEKEHNRMEEVIRKGISTFLQSIDQSLIDCGLLDRSLDKVFPCTNEEGNNFYNHNRYQKRLNDLSPMEYRAKPLKSFLLFPLSI